MGDKSEDETGTSCALTRDSVEQDPLDWSVSEISIASGFDPDRFHSAISSSWNSPLKNINAQTQMQDFQSQNGPDYLNSDLQKLAGSVRDLQLDLAGISRMTVSPRRERADNRSRMSIAASDVDKTPKNATSTFENDVTPPVRDTGPGNRSLVKPSQQSQGEGLSKLDQMKNTLRELEDARKKLSCSKIPRRSLNLVEKSNSPSNPDDPIDIPSTKSKTNSLQSAQTTVVSTRENSDDIISQFFGQTSQSETESDKTVVEFMKNPQLTEKTTEGLLKKLSDEIGNKKGLEAEVEKLRSQLQNQETELQNLKDIDVQKEKLLTDLKSKWTDVAKNWSEQLQKSQEEVTRLKMENESAKKQFYVCEEELSKALQLASDFKQKVDEEEHTKQDILNELLAERANKGTKLQEQESSIKKLLEENSSYRDEIERLRKDMKTCNEDYTNLHNQLENLKKVFAAERANYIREASDWQNKEKILNEKIQSLESELKTRESSLHTFYVSQLESIMLEKVTALQKSVSEWEQTLCNDKKKEFEKLNSSHQEQIQRLQKEFSEKLSEMEKNSEALEASLKAARRESDALREQLDLYEQRRQSSGAGPATVLAKHKVEEEWAALLASQSKFPRFHNNLHSTGPATSFTYTKPLTPRTAASTTDEEENATPRHSYRTTRQKRRPTSASHVMSVMNNMRDNRKAVEVKARPASALNEKSGNPKSNFEANENTSVDETDSLMSISEKKEIVSSFIKQFLDDHPEAVLDASFLGSLNEMAVRLINESLRSEELEEERGRDSPNLLSQGHRLSASSSKSHAKNGSSEGEQLRKNCKKPVWK